MSSPAGATNGSKEHKGFSSDINLSDAFIISFFFHLLLIGIAPEGLFVTTPSPSPLSIEAVIQPKSASDNDLSGMSIDTSPLASTFLEAKGGAQKRLAPSQGSSVRGQGGSENVSEETPPSLLEIDEEGLNLDERGNAGGGLVARMTINRQGRATHIKVMHSSLPPKIEEQVVSRLHWARYRPGEKDGHPVEGVMLLEINVSSNDQILGPVRQ